MIHLPFGRRELARRALVESVTQAAPHKTLTQAEAQDVVDAATAILDGLKVLFVLADQGHPDARHALQQWRDVLGRLTHL